MCTAAALAGLGVRIWLVAGRLGVIDSDEAIPALMGKWLLRGDVRIFHWGQDYGGGLIALPFAISEAIFGTNRAALGIVMLLLDAVAAVLVWRIGTRFLTATQAAFAAFAFWLWPALFVWFGTRPQSFYVVTLVLGLCVVVCAQRAVEERTGYRDWSLAGLCAGLGWWESPNIMYFVVPTLAWLLLRDNGRRVRELVPRALVAIPWATAGAAPWIIFNLIHDFASFPHQPELNEGGYLDHLHYFFVYGLPTALGLRTPFIGDWVIDTGHSVLYGAVLVVLVLALVLAIRAGWSWPALALLAYPFLFALVPFGSKLAFGRFIGNGRYLFFLAPILPLVLATVARRVGVIALLATGMLASSVYGFVKLDEQADTIGGAYPTEPLIARLDRLGVDSVYASHWVAYRLTFETDERIIAIPDDFGIPYPPYLRHVKQSAKPAWVYVAGTPDADRWIELNDAAGIPMRKVRTGHYDIVIPTSKRLPPPLLPKDDQSTQPL